MAQVVARGQRFRQQRMALRRCDQHPHIAVAHDVGDLLGLEQRIQWHEYTAGRGRAETGDHRFKTLFEVNGNPLAALQTEVDGAVREILLRRCQIGIADRLFGEGQRNGFRRAIGRAEDQVGEQKGVGHSWSLQISDSIESFYLAQIHLAVNLFRYAQDSDIQKEIPKSYRGASQYNLCR